QSSCLRISNSFGRNDSTKFLIIASFISMIFVSSSFILQFTLLFPKHQYNLTAPCNDDRSLSRYALSDPSGCLDVDLSPTHTNLHRYDPTYKNLYKSIVL